MSRDAAGRPFVASRGRTTGPPGLPSDGQDAASQFAVDRQVEQRQFPGVVRHLQANSNRPDVFQLEWVFLADQFALVPRNVAGFGFIR